MPLLSPKRIITTREIHGQETERGSWKIMARKGHSWRQRRNKESAMKNISATRRRVLANDTVGRDIASPAGAVLALRAKAEGLNVDAVAPIALLPHGQICAIHFEADATVTIMLGARNYGNGFASPYFASVLLARLGVPFNRTRLYYAGNHPSVRTTPRTPSHIPSRDNVGIVNAAIGDLIEALCERAIEKGRRYLAASMGAAPAAIAFDASGGRFFVVDLDWHIDILDLAKRARGVMRGLVSEG